MGMHTFIFTLSVFALKLIFTECFSKIICFSSKTIKEMSYRKKQKMYCIAKGSRGVLIKRSPRDGDDERRSLK